MRHLLPTLLLLALACQGTTPTPAAPAPDAAPSPAPETPARTAVPAAVRKILPDDAGAPTLDAIAHLDRIPELGARHKELLASHGFFVAPQSGSDGSKPQDAAHARERRRARHLFAVYERNDYIRFPSYVTVDLAIDLTHRYFDAVLRRLEREHLSPRLAAALTAFAEEAVAQHGAARSRAGKAATLAAATYWGTALRLLQQPAKGDAPDEVTVRPPWYDYEDVREEMDAENPRPAPKPRKHPITRFPGPIEKAVTAAVTRVHAAAGRERFETWGQDMDLTLTTPRSHYAGTGTLQRYFRSMSFLGLSQFALEGELARPRLVAVLARSYAARPEAAATYEEALAIANFVVGKPPTAGLRETVDAMGGAATKGPDALVEEENLAPLSSAWSKFPEHPIERRGPVIQPAGQRVFADTQAMSSLLGIINKLPPGEGDTFVTRAMGAAGSAAVLGSDVAAKIVTSAAPRADVCEKAIAKGRRAVGDLAARDDAYHGTLVALREVLSADPQWFEPDAFRLRLLQSYAGGWTELRHDTLLYAYEMGAECDSAEFEPPHGWVEPVPEAYAALEKMVTEFGARVQKAGIKEKEPDYDEGDYEDIQFSTVAKKTEAMVEFLRQLKAWSEKELRGEPFTMDERTEIAMVGGFAEHVLLTLADAFILGEGNDDMAVVADVFTWRGRAVTAGVAHPELIYAVIPTPDGWQLARGAVLAYREFLVPSTGRLTDEAWRKQLTADKDHAWSRRPDWLAPITAPAVGIVELPPKMEGQERCEYKGDVYEL